MENFSTFELMDIREGLGIALLMAKEIERNSLRAARLRELITKISNVIDERSE
jgi:hypothetical protein